MDSKYIYTYLLGLLVHPIAMPKYQRVCFFSFGVTHLFRPEMPQTASFSADQAAISALRPETAVIHKQQQGLTFSRRDEKRDTPMQSRASKGLNWIAFEALTRSSFKTWKSWVTGTHGSNHQPTRNCGRIRGTCQTGTYPREICFSVKEAVGT